MQITKTININLSQIACYFLCLLLGWLQSVSLATPWNEQTSGWLQILAFAVFISLINNPLPKDYLIKTWLFTTSWLGCTFWWLFISLHVYGELFIGFAILAVLILASLLALYYVLALALFKLFSPSNILLQGILLASLWSLAELARAILFTGFPWGAIGYAHIDQTVLDAFAPWIGVYGISWFATFCAFCLGVVIRHIFINSLTNQNLILASIGLITVLLLSLATKQTNNKLLNNPKDELPPISLTLLQANVPQETKFNFEGIYHSLEWYQNHSKEINSKLIIMPETAIPIGQDLLPSSYLDKFAQQAQQKNQAIITGMMFYNDNGKYSNSILAFSPQHNSFQTAYRYDKQHLVPFGEFVPNILRWFTDLLNIPYDDLIANKEFSQYSFSWQQLHLAMTICFEDLFGEEIAKYFLTSQKPNILVNISNISWFGNTSIIPQHLNISRMRSLEFNRPMLRASNSGASAIIDRYGKVINKLDYYVEGQLNGQVSGNNYVTPYTLLVSQYGLYPLLTISLILSLVISAISLLNTNRKS